MSNKVTQSAIILVSSVTLFAATGYSVTNSPAQSSDTKVVPGADSYRLTFELKTPRRFASRYNAEKRSLQLRVAPARADEFEASRYYDSKYIQRVIIEEQNGDVVITLQLKDESMGWVILAQNDPWRIMVDLWRTETSPRSTLAEEWKWQDNLQKNAQGSVSAEPVQAKAHESNTADSHLDIMPIETAKIDTSKPEVATPASQHGFPENFGRLDTPIKLSSERLQALQRQVGMVLGSKVEYQASATLAEELYKADQPGAAVVLYRRIAALNQQQFKETPRTIWLAAESAYLSKNFDLSNDYLRALSVSHPKSDYASLAALRRTDIEALQNNVTTPQAGQVAKKSMPENISASYADIALSESSAWQARIAATLRLLHGYVDLNPDAAKLYQQNLNACVKGSLVPFEMRKNCAYIQTRYAIERTDILSADAEIQRFKQLAPEDTRIANLDGLVQKSIRSMLEDINKSKAWDTWIGFEKKARPELLNFTLKEPDMMFARAESWEVAGEPKKAAQLYAIHWQLAADDKKKNETAAIAARLFYKSGEGSKADIYLKRIEASETRRTSGLGDRAIGAVREIALAPYRNRLALRILMDEIGSGRYVEHELPALIQFASMQKASGAADTLYDKILVHPPKSNDEATTIESTLLKYADDLRNSNRNSRAGEMYLAVANTNKSGKRAEAAYKAGISFMRAGLLEKAKTSWQMSASDLNDKRYASLAAERLETLK